MKVIVDNEKKIITVVHLENFAELHEFIVNNNYTDYKVEVIGQKHESLNTGSANLLLG